jgi:hypothetical protein
MSNNVPIIIILLVGILALVALLAIRMRTRQKEELEPLVRNKKVFWIPFILGLSLSLAGAFFMFDGDILGENTTGIATVIGIIGIGLIATSNAGLRH